MADVGYNPVDKEKTARALYLEGLPTNGTTNQLTDNEVAATQATIQSDINATLPTNYTCRVITALGNYFIIKFYYLGKVVTTYKAKDVADLTAAKSEALAFFNVMTKIAPEALVATPNPVTKAAGQTQVVTITATPSGASVAVTGVTSNAAKATVSGTTITAVAAGTCNITFTSTSSNASVVVPVTVT